MTDERATRLFFELFDGLPRQGPGDEGSTLRALGLVPRLQPGMRVLDLGCGTGSQTRVLARQTGARIVAIDSHAPFVDELSRQARALGLHDLIDARVGDMRALHLPPASFDLIWSEGAIFVVGFEAGLREWRRWLRPCGHLAVTEVCWTKPDPPPDCAAFWAEEYPDIRDVTDRLIVIEGCGYQLVDHFTLPPSSWWDEYYRPLQGNIATFRERHRDERDAQDLADRVQREVDVWHRCAEHYGYEFFVMRAG
jgi:ubiquinone/menaquinone biosynthesis C-methylase UbiE